jgi:hypothetical protein
VVRQELARDGWKANKPQVATNSTRLGGALTHSEWINTKDAFPNFQFAESLMEYLGSAGTVFMWATHENTILTVQIYAYSSLDYLTRSGESTVTVAEYGGNLKGNAVGIRAKNWLRSRDLIPGSTVEG